MIRPPLKNKTLFVAIVLLLVPFDASSARQEKVSVEVQAMLDRISADSMRGHLSFLASDLLEGRFTPSRGLDTAALYIAAQFRRAGLEPAGDDGYFQTANWFVSQPDLNALDFKIRHEGQTIAIRPDRISFQFETGLDLDSIAAFKVDYADAATLAALSPDSLAGKAVLTEIPDFRREERSRWGEMMRAQNEFLSRMSAAKVAVVLSVDRRSSAGAGAGPVRLIDPESRPPARTVVDVPMITIHDAAVASLFDKLKPGQTAAELKLKLPPPVETKVKIRNVIGLLRGSDPALKDTYVLVTAHYDHIGVRPSMEGDNIFNGANDDGSGTVSVIEIATALSSMKVKPKRSIVFVTFFGEERGLLGSRFYGRHPVFQIEKTVADINLEQVGRTDSTEGPQVANASMTGFDFSDVGIIFKTAGELTGITVYKHERNSDAYFGRSDNQALADQGVPAHTLCTAFDYPDYHGVGDHWEKIDYENMARVDRMVVLGLTMIANNPEAPKWNEANPKAARYLSAWKLHHPASTVTQQ